MMLAWWELSAWCRKAFWQISLERMSRHFSGCCSRDHFFRFSRTWERQLRATTSGSTARTTTRRSQPSVKIPARAGPRIRTRRRWRSWTRRPSFSSKTSTSFSTTSTKASTTPSTASSPRPSVRSSWRPPTSISSSPGKHWCSSKSRLKPGAADQFILLWWCSRAWQLQTSADLFGMAYFYRNGSAM